MKKSNLTLRALTLALTLIFSATLTIPALALTDDEIWSGMQGKCDTLHTAFQNACNSGHHIEVGRGHHADWADKELSMADELGLVPSVVSDYFQEPITRQDFCTLAVNTLSVATGYPVNTIRLSGSGSFSDCSNEDVKACASLGIVSGYPDGSFKPQNSISRQEAAKILDGMAATLGYNYGTSAGGFYDTNGLWGESHIRSVAAMKNPYNGSVVMGGTGAGYFSPHQSYDRQQAVITMYRLCGTLVSQHHDRKNASQAQVTPGTYISDKGSGEYNPTITLKSDGTFTMKVNLFEGMGNVSGTWQNHNGMLDCRITSRDFSGVSGDTVTAFNLYVSAGSLSYAGEALGMTQWGDSFLLSGSSQQPTQPTGALQTGTYYSNLGLGSSEPRIEIKSGNAFTMTANLYEGFGTLTGTYTLSGSTATFTVNARNFSGVTGDDVNSFTATVSGSSLIYHGSWIGITSDGDVFTLGSGSQPSGGTQQGGDHGGSSALVPTGVYVCDQGAGSYNPKIQLNSNGTFVFTVNLWEGSGTVSGTYSLDTSYAYSLFIDFVITSRSFWGFAGDDVEDFFVSYENGAFKYCGDSIGTTEYGHMFYFTSAN